MMLLCAALLAGCSQRDSQEQADKPAPARRARERATTSPATARAAPPAATRPMTAEAIYAQAVEILARASGAKSAQQRSGLLAQAARNVPRWYAHLKLPPPDPTNSGWLTVVLWDTMPEAEYRRVVQESRELFRARGEPFPASAGRRELFKALEELRKEMGTRDDTEENPGPGREP